MNTHSSPRRAPRHRFGESQDERLRRLGLIRKDCYGLAAAFEDWSLILTAGGYLIWALQSGWVWAWAGAPIAWLIIGTRMRGLATLVHEESHKSLTRTRWLGELIGTLFSAWPVFQLLGRYTISHVKEHHRFLGDEDADPDIANYVRQGLLDQKPDSFVALNSLKLLSGIQSAVQLPYLLRDRLLPTGRAALSDAEKRELAGFVLFWTAIVVIVALNSWWLEFLLVWLLPYLTVFQAVGWLIETAEHFPLNWLESDHIKMTRNRKGSALERFFFGIHGESWHRIHHERQGIAFPLLAQAHAIMMEDPVYAAGETETGGLFTKGPNGEPSIISALPDLMRKAQAQTF